MIKNAPEQTLLLLEQKGRFASLRQLDLGWVRDKSSREPVEHATFTREQALEVLLKCEEVDVEIIMTTTMETSAI